MPLLVMPQDRNRNPQWKDQERSPMGTFKPAGDEPMGKPICVALPQSVDAAVRALPNRSEWLRRVISEAARAELLKED